MAPKPNNISIAKDTELINACESLLMQFAVEIQQTEAPWTGSSGQTTAYTKRIDLAKTIIDTKAKIHGSICAVMIAEMKPDIVVNISNNYDYLLSQRACECQVNQNGGFSTVGYNQGIQLWDSLAGVNQQDIV